MPAGFRADYIEEHHVNEDYDEYVNEDYDEYVNEDYDNYDYDDGGDNDDLTTDDERHW